MSRKQGIHMGENSDAAIRKKFLDSHLLKTSSRYLVADAHALGICDRYPGALDGDVFDHSESFEYQPDKVKHWRHRRLMIVSQPYQVKVDKLVWLSTKLGLQVYVLSSSVSWYFTNRTCVVVLFKNDDAPEEWKALDFDGALVLKVSGARLELAPYLLGLEARVALKVVAA